MRLDPFLRALRALGRRAPRARPRRPAPARPRAEALEGRALRAAALPDIALISAATADSRVVTVDYEVRNAPVTAPIDFGIYRSADARFDPTDLPVAAAVLAPDSPDLGGLPAGAVGTHRIALAVPGGLTIVPSRPYVLAVADPAGTLAESDTTDNTAGFRKYAIGVVTHGGIQDKDQSMPPDWALRMARALQGQGYDATIPFNWSFQSRTPGAAAKQGPRLARSILRTVAEFPPAAPVDLHIIGHSQGNVVDTQALRYLQRHPSPQLQAGWTQETLLDPHAANNHVPGDRQYSVSSGLLGTIARNTIDDYQRRADDPPIYVPSNVDQSEVFYQHTPISQAGDANGGVYNLWGQVPIRGAQAYYDLTGPGITHSGRTGIQVWYQTHVVPTLGQGPGAFVNPALLTGGPAGVTAKGQDMTTPTGTAHYGGSATPGSTVRVLASRSGATHYTPVGQTIAGPSGAWAVTTDSLPTGRYRLIARSTPPPDPTPPQAHPSPVISLGELRVGGAEVGSRQGGSRQ